MNRTDASKEISRVNKFIKDISVEKFRGDMEKAFLYWGAELYLSTIGVADLDLLESMTDGPNDLEADLIYINEDEKKVHIIGSRYQSTPRKISRRDVDAFYRVVENLFDSSLLNTCSNRRICDFAPKVQDCVRDGYFFDLVWITTGYSTSELSNHIEKLNDERKAVMITGKEYQIEFKLSIFDLKRILDEVSSICKYKSIDETIRYATIAHSEANQINCCLLVVPASELVRVFNKHGYTLFQFNPRYYLGSRVINKKIRETLEDPSERLYFHIYNNGLSAICSTYKINEHRKEITINDLQIVNGCQTTYTLADVINRRRIENPDHVFVTIKLVGGEHEPTVRRKISRYSNAQSAVSDWDFLYYESIHQRLKEEFRHIKPNPPKEGYFYETRRGEFQFIARANPRDMIRIKVQDAAQVLWAFDGHPGEAKDKPREIARDEKKHREVFHDSISASHIRLPFEVFLRIREQIRGEVQDYAKFHILWLIGELIKICRYNRRITTFSTLLAAEFDKIFEDFDEWFSRYFELAKQVVESVAASEAERQKKDFNLKQLFRTETDKFREKLEEKLKDIWLARQFEREIEQSQQKQTGL